MQRSPVDDAHRESGARMGTFAGWEMPISYPAGTLAEHAAVRERVGLFDVSHLGKLVLRGPGARDVLEATLTNRMADLAPGRARYALLCQDDAGVIDDLIAYAIDDGEVLVVPNASNRDAVAAVLQRSLPTGTSMDVADLTTFAIQGPRSKAIVESAFPVAKGLPYMGVAVSDGVVIARSGYTGEWGYEVFTTSGQAAGMWLLLQAAVRDEGGELCGLAARDTLRLEMGYPLHGNDITTGVNPIEAGLGWAVKLEGRSFPGADVLRGYHPGRALVGLRGDHRVIPRPGCPVMSGAQPVGVVTSGTLSPTLRQPIGLALVSIEAISGVAEVDVRGRLGLFDIVDPPFVDASPKRQPD